MFALVVLENIVGDQTPAPAIVPSGAGGLQLEWHTKGIDLEIHIEAPYVGEVWWRDRRSHEERSAELRQDLSFLHEPIGRLSRI